MKGNEVATSSHRQDYKPYGADVKPDTAVRRNALSKSEVSDIWHLTRCVERHLIRHLGYCN